MLPEQPVPEVEAVERLPEPEIQSEPDYIAQAQSQQVQLAAYQAELSNEAAAIKEMERDARSFRKDNPGEYAARMADIQLRSNRLNQAAAQFQAHVSSLEKHVAERYSSDYARKLQREEAQLQREIGWNGEKKAALAKHLKSLGYTDAQLAQVNDAKTVKLAWQAMQAEQSKKVLPKKKVDPRAAVESDIQRRNLGTNSTQAAAARIQAMGLFK